jgi:ABC-type spermidine/putrescine transport system permease subunit II
MWSVVEDNFGYWLAVTFVTFVCALVAARVLIETDRYSLVVAVVSAASAAFGTTCTAIRWARRRRKGRRTPP